MKIVIIMTIEMLCNKFVTGFEKEDTHDDINQGLLDNV